MDSLLDLLEKDDIQVDNKPKKKGKQLIKSGAETAISVNGNSKSQELIQNNRCTRGFQTLLSSSGGVILKKHSDTNSKLIPGNNISFTSAAHQRSEEGKSTQHELHLRRSMSKNTEQERFTNIKQPKKKVKHIIKSTAETLISINGNSKSLEFNIQNVCRKGDFQNFLRSSGGVILKNHSNASCKLVPGNNMSFTSAAHQRFKGNQWKKSLSKKVSPTLNNR